jgi:hypothetical protein
VLLAAVLPSSHAPGWQLALLRKRGVPVLEGANWRAEEIEELLEAHVDVIVRVPEPSARKRADRRRGHGVANRGGIPPGCVAFVCRSREGNR